MDHLDMIQAVFVVIQLVFVFAFGACIGSLTNVLVYRLPLGLNVVTPPSRCPFCGTQLTWRENIPVFGWLMLGGRCRFCRSKISAEYPIVEAFMGLLWVAVYVMLYAEPGWAGWSFLRKIQPEWSSGYGGFRETWPIFIVWITLISSLVAATLVDAKTATIPAMLTNAPLLVALVLHPAFAVYCQYATPYHGLAHHAPDWWWAIATPGPHGWWWIGASLGGVVGLLIANLFLRMGIFKRSFADYEEWEKSLPPQADTAGSPTDVWIQYPHARREMLRELIFLSPVFGFGMAGAALATRLAAPWTTNPVTGNAVFAHPAPLWLMVLAGVCMGYLIGGGVVWVVRILGSLAFGKEAMGLGDVHLMAAVGACLGWPDAVLGFFGATFVGLFWAILGRLGSGVFKRAMPFGPYLAVATVLVLFCKPWIEKGLTLMFHASPPINLP